MKKCTKCGILMDESDFHKNRNEKDGRNHWCKHCCINYHAEKKKKYPTKLRERNRKHYQANKDRARDRRYLRVYGLTPEQYDEILKKQNGCCAICGKHYTEAKHRLCVDHSHETGINRELLCDSCNRMIGFAKEDVEILKSAIDYLQHHNQKE